MLHVLYSRTYENWCKDELARKDRTLLSPRNFRRLFRSTNKEADNNDQYEQWYMHYIYTSLGTHFVKDITSQLFENEEHPSNHTKI